MIRGRAEPAGSLSPLAAGGALVGPALTRSVGGSSEAGDIGDVSSGELCGGRRIRARAQLYVAGNVSSRNETEAIERQRQFGEMIEERVRG
jgi:hypothetical protein